MLFMDNKRICKCHSFKLSDETKYDDQYIENMEIYQFLQQKVDAWIKEDESKPFTRRHIVGDTPASWKDTPIDMLWKEVIKIKVSEVGNESRSNLSSKEKEDKIKEIEGIASIKVRGMLENLLQNALLKHKEKTFNGRRTSDDQVKYCVIV